MLYATFFIAKKVAKKSSASKNSLLHPSICLALRLLARLPVFQDLLFTALWPKKGQPVGSDNLEARGFSLIRNDFISTSTILLIRFTSISS